MDTQGTNQTVVVDIQIPFWSMVVFMIKWAFAAVPAIIIISVWLTLLSSLPGLVSVGFR
jgi:hypothetical protein